tara:strand:+ start:106 stop:753 length:648 start_codon:yes stop_codon:yes gene_type:complete
MAKAVVTHDGRNWELGELFQRHVPRGVAQFTVRHDEATASSSDVDTHVSEHSVFVRIFNASGQTIPVATMKRLRNTSATFPVGKRCETATWSAHRAGESLAWRDNQGHRANLLTWLGDEARTVTDVEDHVRAMMAKLDGTVVTKTTGKDGDDSPNGHDLDATTTITGDELLARGIANLDAYDGSPLSEDGAMVRHITMMMEAFNVVITSTETVDA